MKEDNTFKKELGIFLDWKDWAIPIRITWENPTLPYGFILLQIAFIIIEYS